MCVHIQTLFRLDHLEMYLSYNYILGINLHLAQLYLSHPKAWV